jgi:hypothetical protein
MVRDLDTSNDREAGVHRITWDLGGPEGGGGKGGFAKKKGPPPAAEAATESGGETPVPAQRFGGFGGRQAAKPGTYRVVLSVDGTDITRLLVVEPDPRTRTPGTVTDEAEELRQLLKTNP